MRRRHGIKPSACAWSSFGVMCMCGHDTLLSSTLLTSLVQTSSWYFLCV